MLMRRLDLQVSQQSSQLQLSLLQVWIRSSNEIGLLITDLSAEPDRRILHYEVKIHHQLESGVFIKLGQVVCELLLHFAKLLEEACFVVN